MIIKILIYSNVTIYVKKMRKRGSIWRSMVIGYSFIWLLLMDFIMSLLHSSSMDADIVLVDRYHNKFIALFSMAQLTSLEEENSHGRWVQYTHHGIFIPSYILYYFKISPQNHDNNERWASSNAHYLSSRSFPKIWLGLHKDWMLFKATKKQVIL